MEEREDIEDDQFFFSHAPRMPEDDIINSEVAILTGGRDQHGRPIIAFPAKYHGILESKVKASGMETLFRYFNVITRAADRKRGFAFVTDLRFATIDFILLLKSTLNSIQAEMKGAIGTCVLYVILPLNKKTHKDTLTHLALRLSKKKINKNIVPPYFQSVAVQDEMELYNYIEKSHLTPELGGYMQYSHHDWVTFRRIVEPFFANFESVQVRLPNAYERLTAMANVTVENSKEQLQETHDQLQDVFNDIKRSLHLDQVLEQCEELLPRFGSCDEEDVFAVLAQKPIFKETKETVEGCYQILTAAKRKIDDGWNDMSRRMTQAVQLIDYRTDVNKLLDWFKSKREKDLQQGADVADNLSHAEMLYNHYKTGLQVNAEEKLSRASGLVRQGEAMAADAGSHRVSDNTTLAETLKREARGFQNALQEHQRILQSVYHFHQLYNKARRWYVKCIKFLPSDLRDLFHDLRSHSGHDSRALRLQWEEDVRRFLNKNPLLAKEELKKVKTIPEDVGADSLKKKGRLLSYRCLILTNLLNHDDKTFSVNIKDILKWRSEFHSQPDDSSSHQSEIPPSMDQMRKTPSDSSLDTSHQSHRRKKPDSKRPSKTTPKSKTLEKQDSYYRSAHTPDRTRRHSRHRDRYSDTNINRVNETDNEDPLIARLGNAGSFYNRHREGQDEVDDAKWEDTGRNRTSERMHNGATHEDAQPSSSHQQYIPAHSRHLHSDHSPSAQSAPEHARTYGIYGDSDVEDDTAAVIHHQGPPHLPQGLPEDMLPGHQLQHAQPGNQKTASSMDPSNIALGNQSSYGLIQQDPNQSQPDYRTAAHSSSMYPSTQFSTHRVHPQHGPSTVHHNGTPANFNVNPYSPTSHSHHTLPYNHLHPSLSPLGTSSKGAPISFHGSLMNIHHPRVDNGLSAMGGLDTDRAEAINSSPVSRHRSLMDLSQSPIVDQAGNASLQYMPTSPVRTDQQHVHSPQSAAVTSRAVENGAIYPINHDLQNPPHGILSSRLKHGVSEPIIYASPHDDSTSPYSVILANLIELRARTNTRPAQSTLRLPKYRQSKKATHSPSRNALSRSEMDLRYSQKNMNSPLTPNGLPHTEHPLHQSEVNLRQSVPNSHSASANQSVVLPTQNASPLGSPTDPQVEYYKRLSSTSSPNQSTTASGHRDSDHTLDPSVHTWMHDIPSPQTRHQSRLFARIHSTSRPLSPLALLEMEVAKETMNAEEAIQEDEYNKEQLRRQAVIDSILDQSEPSIRSHDSTFQRDRKVSSQEQVTLANGQRGQRSDRRHRQGKSDLHNSPRKVDKQMLRNSSPNSSIPRKARYTSSQREATNITIPGSSEVNKSKYLPSSHKVDILHSQPGSLIAENGWREQHLDDAGVTALRIHNDEPTSVHRLSNTPRGLTSTERHLGLSTTLPQPIQNQNHVSGPGIASSDSRHLLSNPQRHSPYSTTGASLDKPTSPGEKHDSEVDWRQEHLKELGLSPAATVGLTVSQYGLKEGLTPSKPISPSVSLMNWREQHLRDLGISPSMHHTSLRQDSAIEAPHTVSLSELNGGDWRSQHLLELGISSSMHHSGLSQDSTTTEALGRHQHPLELGISPSLHHSVSYQNPVAPNEKPADRRIESDWRRNYLNNLGIHPRMHQYPAPSTAAPGGNIAPVTSRLRGVIGSGRSLNDMEEIHQLADETTKKSVRFAHLSDDSILDAEEQAQDELALRLHQLELKLQEEENSLNHQDLLDEEEATLDQQLRDLDQQDGLQIHVRDAQIGHQVLLEGAVQSMHNQTNQRKQASAQPGHQVLLEGIVQPKHVQNGQYVQAYPDHQVLLEGAIQPTHVQGSQHIDLKHTLEGAVPRVHFKSKSLFPEVEKRTGITRSNPEMVRSRRSAQNGHQSTILTPDSSLREGKTGRSDRMKLQSYSKPSRNDTTKVSEIRDSVDLNDQSVLDHHLTQAAVHSFTESSNMQDHRLSEAQSKGTSSVDNDRGLNVRKPTDLGSNPTASDTQLAESLQRANKTLEQFSLSEGTPHHDIANEIIPLESSQTNNHKFPYGVPPVKQQGAIESRDLRQEDLNKIIDGGQNASRKSINDSSERHQTPDKFRDLKDEVEDRMIRQIDEVIPSDERRPASLSERDHTAADYIACALGMEYVNDQSHLTVRPYINSSKLSTTQQQYNKHLNEAEDQDYSQPQQRRVGGTSPLQSGPNHSQTSGPTWNDSRAQDLGTDRANATNDTGISSDGREDDRNARGLTSKKGAGLRLQSFPSGLQEGPCSPIRQWLKEKEITDNEGIGSNHSEQGLASKAVDQQTANSMVESPSNVVQALSPTMSSQSTSPIREWLREKQVKEAHKSNIMHRDLAVTNNATDSSLTDGSEENSGMRSTKSIDGDIPNFPRGQTNSLITLPVGSRKMSDVGKPGAKTPSQLGARRISNSSIPVYKGLSKSSPPKTKELSPSGTSTDANNHGNPPGADHTSCEMMKTHDISSKKGNQLSKIPVSKVYTALKDAGYLDNTKHLKEQSPPQQVSASKKPFASSASENSKSNSRVSATEEARPVLEKQGTFTKEPRPTLTRGGTFTIESEDGNKQGHTPKSATQGAPVLRTASEEKSSSQASSSPLALVLDHMLRKGGVPTSRKQEAHTTHGGKKRHDSVEETFENSSTESSMSPTTKSVMIMSKKPTTNLYNTKNYYISAQEGGIKSQVEVTGSKAKGHDGSIGTYDGLSESDRIEHDGMDDNELEKMMVTKGQLAEIRNLEIENRHLAYERKEFEAQYIKNLQKHHLANSSDEA